MEKIKFMDEETGRFLSRIYFSLPDDEGNYRSCYYGVLFKLARKASWTGEKAVMGCIRLLFFHVLPPLPCHSACFLPGFFFFKELYIPYGNSVNAAVAVNYAISFPRIYLEPEKGLG